MKNQITTIIIQAVNEILEEDGNKTKVNEATTLFGDQGVLDSMGLVNLLTLIEEIVEDELKQDIIIADEKAMSLNNSPFKSIEKLSDHICALIKSSANE